MNQWTKQFPKYTPEEVQLYCVKDTSWQNFRRSLKGKPTAEKLDRLELYIQDMTESVAMPRGVEVQVSNYISALIRGGQLDAEGKVIR